MFCIIVHLLRKVIILLMGRDRQLVINRSKWLALSVSMSATKMCPALTKQKTFTVTGQTSKTGPQAKFLEQTRLL